jgi:hypothetical protein
MLRLHSKIICTIVNRFDDDRRTAGRAHGSGQRLERLPSPSIPRHEEHWAGISLRDRMNRVGRDPDNSDYRDCHDQQQHERTGTKYQATPLRREGVKHDRQPISSCTTTPA